MATNCPRLHRGERHTCHRIPPQHWWYKSMRHPTWGFLIHQSMAKTHTWTSSYSFPWQWCVLSTPERCVYLLEWCLWKIQTQTSEVHFRICSQHDVSFSRNTGMNQALIWSGFDMRNPLWNCLKKGQRHAITTRKQWGGRGYVWVMKDIRLATKIDRNTAVVCGKVLQLRYLATDTWARHST